MTAQPVTHPSPDALREFALGKLSDSAASALMSHLDNCADCGKRIAAISGDDFLNRLRQARSHSSTFTPVQALSDTALGRKSSSNQPVPGLPPELANSSQYEIVRELGRGGMGVVYLANNKLMDRLEVLKVVNKALIDNPAAVERFLREIRSAARLSHPNVVAAYSAVQQGQLLAFAMEYVEGQDLASLVKSQGPLPVPHACFYVHQAALGLQHAFEKQMVHRDIKPQNLVLAREGKKHVVKVLDFGLAKLMSEKKEDTGLTGEGKMLGTPDYIAPEQTLDAAKADIRADIYSLGCTLYYLLSGRAPFSGSSMGAVLMAHQSQEAKLLNLVRPDVPEDLAAVVRKMMGKSPAKRYQTPLEVAQALAPFVKLAATPKPPLDLSVSAVEPKPAVNKVRESDSPPAPMEKKAKQQPNAFATGESAGVARVPSAGLEKPEPHSNGTSGSPPPPNTPASGFPKPQKVWEDWPEFAPANPRKKWIIGSGIGAGVLLLALLCMLAAGVFELKTPDGILVVKVNEPNPDVYVDGQKLTVSWDNGGKKAETSVKPGTHKVELKKDGFIVDGTELTFKDGDRAIFNARLVPNQRENPTQQRANADAPQKPQTDARPVAPQKPQTDARPVAPRKPQTDARPVADAPGDDQGFVSLFNGKDLAGWWTEGEGKWKVETDGTLVGEGPDAAIVSTRTDFIDFTVRAMLSGSADVEAFLGVRMRQAPNRSWRGMTARVFGNGSIVKAGHADQAFVTNERGMKRLSFDPGELFRLAARVNKNVIWVTTNGQVTAGCGCRPDPSGAVALFVRRGMVRVAKLEIK